MKLIPQQTIIVDDQGHCVATMERGGFAQRLADAQTIAHRVNVHDELVAALAGMLAINDSVTQGQEREYREKFLPMARAALKRAKK